MKRKTLIIDGLTISYLEQENPKKDVLLFLHGWGCDANIFAKLFSFFEKDFHIVSIDFPGFGKSTIPNNGMTISDYSDFLQKFIEKSKLKNIHAITHSFGGRVSIDITSKNKDIFKSLTLINSGGIKNTSFRVKTLKVISKFGKCLGLSFLKNFFYKYIVREEDAINALSSPAIKTTYQNVVGEDLQERAKSIETPTLLLWGEKDESTPLWHGKKWNELIKNSQMYTHSGDHFFFLQDPNWTVKHIQKFLGTSK